ncbi:MAG: zinc ABC transporter substrate-binding protein [Anaerolineae bacterium]|nr:zinc ABC transporter substrate-binding protein [Anaerolineae bacterium]
MKKITAIAVLLLLATSFLIGCGEASGVESAENTVNIVTTIGQIYDIATNIGGEHVSVTALMGPGSDPHQYTASASEVNRLQDADIVFYNGLFLEAQMEDILEQIGERKPSVPVSRDIARDNLLASPLYDDEYDPHIWFEVPLWMEAAKTVRDTLIEVDPAKADDYRANADGYLAELEALHAYVQEQADRVPESKRVLITAHDAFSYFGRTYGFQVLGLQGISTASEASTADVQRLTNFIVANEIPAIFIESSVPVRNVEAVQAAVANQGFTVEIGGELFSDAMGDWGTEEGTYVGMVRHNIDTIVGALLAE